MNPDVKKSTKYVANSQERIFNQVEIKWGHLNI